ncbi:MAG: hypothetical protein R8K20_11075 [Gallionellaceae bacterium]
MNIKDRLKIFFYERAPNSVLEEFVVLEFGDTEASLLKEALSLLENEKFLASDIPPTNQRCTALQRKTFRITPEALGDYPIKTEIEAAGIRVPRLIDGDKGRAEDVNNLIHAVNKIIDAKTRQLEHRMEEQNRKYWSALVTIFALFISLFSIINVGVKPVLFSEELALSPM